MVQMVQVNLEVPKELNDIRVAVVKIVSDIKDGLGLSAVLTNLALLMQAVEGVDKMPMELKEKLAESVELFGVMSGELVKVLQRPKIVQTIG